MSENQSLLGGVLQKLRDKEILKSHEELGGVDKLFEEFVNRITGLMTKVENLNNPAYLGKISVINFGTKEEWDTLVTEIDQLAGNYGIDLSASESQLREKGFKDGQITSILKAREMILSLKKQNFNDLIAKGRRD